MATPTYDPIASTTLTSSASSVTFSSLDTIAAGYRDLVLVVNAANDAGSRPTYVYINGDTAYNYYYVEAVEELSSSGVQPQINTSNADRTYTSFGTTILYQFFDFNQTDKHKSILIRANNNNALATPRVGMSSFRWANTSAVTSLQINPSNGNWISGSVFSLYGIVA